MSNISIKPIDRRTLSGATNLDQNGPGSNSNGGSTPHSPQLQHYRILTIRCFNVISRTLIEVGGSYSSAEITGLLKQKSKSLLIAAQSNGIKNNYIKAKMDNTQQNRKCWLCGDRDEMVNHIISESSRNTRLHMTGRKR